MLPYLYLKWTQIMWKHIYFLCKLVFNFCVSSLKPDMHVVTAALACPLLVYWLSMSYDSVYSKNLKDRPWHWKSHLLKWGKFPFKLPLAWCLILNINRRSCLLLRSALLELVLLHGWTANSNSTLKYEKGVEFLCGMWMR